MLNKLNIYTILTIIDIEYCLTARQLYKLSNVMPTGELTHTIAESNPDSQFLMKPLLGEKLKPVLSNLDDGILYLSKIGVLKETINIVSKSTPLFNSFSDSTTFENIVASDQKYVAGCDGIFVQEQGIPKIIPVSNDAMVEIGVSDDKMTATLTVYPSLPGGKSLQVTDVLKAMQKAGIKTGVDKNTIKTTLLTSSNRKQPIRDVKVAAGKLPGDGEDGRIECTIDWQIHSKPSVNKNGTLDFHEIHSVVAVNKDQVVGKIIPPRKGTRGNDIFNNTIEAPLGKAADISSSHNVYVSTDDDSTIHSKIDGFLEFTNSSIIIKEQHVVSGNIDFHTGNISGNGSLKISGSVLNGFRLNLRDDIEIGGNVGDAIIDAGKNIIVKGGFSGTEHGKIKAGGDVSLKYIENQNLYSNGTLTFSKNIVNSNVYISNYIKGSGGGSCIVGGYTIAGQGIEVASIGNDSGTRTIIELGYDFSIREKIESNRQKIEEAIEQVKKIDRQIISFSEMKRLNPTQVESLKTIAEERKSHLSQVESLKEQNEELKNKTLEPSSALLKCTRKIYPGVTVVINGRQLEIKEVMNGKTFQLSKEGEITF